jgi:hypothetical protein
MPTLSQHPDRVAGYCLGLLKFSLSNKDLRSGLIDLRDSYRIKDCCRASERAATKSGVELNPQVQDALLGISMPIWGEVSGSLLLTGVGFRRVGGPGMRAVVSPSMRKQFGLRQKRSLRQRSNRLPG